MIFWLACRGHPALDTPVAVPSVTHVAPHRGEAAAARDALVFGDVVGFRDRMEVLERRLPLMGDAVREARFIEAVRGATKAPDAATAGRAIGAVAVACGECHTSVGVVPRVRVALAAEGDGVRAEMLRHDRALGLVWDGLTRPDDQDLYGGASAFRESFLIPLYAPATPAAQALDEAVTGSAERLAGTRDPRLRAERFGELVGNCAACHASRPGGITLEPD